MFFILPTLHELHPEVSPSLCALPPSPPHTPLSLCTPGAVTLPLQFSCSPGTPQPSREPGSASGWHGACRGLSCQLPFPHQAVAAAAPHLGWRVGCHRGRMLFVIPSYILCMEKAGQPSLKINNVPL